MMLERPDHIFENPDGHGGAIPALLASGALDDMAERGVDTLFYYQVDNPLVRIGDPAFLGFHAQRAAEASVKVVRKQDPAEKVGVVAQIDADRRRVHRDRRRTRAPRTASSLLGRQHRDPCLRPRACGAWPSAPTLPSYHARRRRFCADASGRPASRRSRPA
jgi:hypothetical protein